MAEVVEDWEDGDIAVGSDVWSGWNGETGTLSAQQSVVIAGSWTGEYESVQDGSSRDTNHRVRATRDADFESDLLVHVRLAEDRAGLSAGTSSDLEIENAAGSRICTLAFDEDGGIEFFSGASTFEGNVVADWSADTNYKLELKNWDFTNDTVDVFLDDVDEGTFTIATGFSGWGRIQFLSLSDIGESSQFFYWDDFTVFPTVAAISDLSATESEDDIDLSWSDAGEETGYDVHRSTSSGFTPSSGNRIAQLSADTTSYTDAALAEDTYYYKVVATAESNTTSNEASATVLVSPTDFTATEPNWDATLSVPCTWTDNSDYAGEEYYIQADSGSGFSRVTSDLGTDATSTTLTDSHLSYDTTYDLRAEVATADGSFFSSSVQVTTPMSGLPTEGYWLAVVGDTASDRRVLSDVTGPVNLVREHTALSDYSIDVAYDESLEGLALPEVHVHFDENHLFAGEYRRARSDERGLTTTLRGPGAPGRKLERGSAAVRYQNQLADVAIQDYLDNHSNIGGTVTTPSVETVNDVEQQAADTTAEFNAILPAGEPEATDPWESASGNTQLLDTGFYEEAEDADRETGGRGTAGSESDNYSEADGEVVESTNDAREWDITPPHDIPAADVGIQVRDGLESGSQTAPAFTWTLGGSAVDTLNTAGTSLGSLGWRDIGSGSLDGSGYQGGDLSGGTTYTLKLEVDDGGDASDIYPVDAVFVYDKGTRFSPSFSYTFDNVTDVDDHLVGPELKPDQLRVPFAQIGQTYRITAVSIAATLNDTTGNQALGWSVDGGSTWTDTSNTSSITDAPVSTPTTTITGSVVLGRTDDTRTTATPTTGFNGQVLQSWQLLIDGDTRGVIEDEWVQGDHLENIQKLCKRAGMRMVIGHDSDGANWSIEAFKRGDVTASASWEVQNPIRDYDLGEYANKVVGFGARDATGERISVEETDDAEVSTFGKTVETTFTDPSIETTDGLRSAVRVELDRATAEDQLAGTLEIFPEMVDPGKRYTVAELGGGDFDLERVSYDIGPDGARGQLQFSRPEGLGEAVSGTRSEVSEVRDSV